MERSKRPAIQFFSQIVVILALPALCFSAFVLFLVWGAMVGGAGVLEALAVIALALALPFLAVFGPVQARRERTQSWQAWAWLASPFLPFVILMALVTV